jgi:hypothetical protein
MAEGRRGGKKGRKYGRQGRNKCDLGQKARTTANKLARIARDAAKKNGRSR